MIDSVLLKEMNCSKYLYTNDFKYDNNLNKYVRNYAEEIMLEISIFKSILKLFD